MPMNELFELRGMRHKLETTEGTDAVPAAVDAVLIQGGEAQISSDPLERNLDTPNGGAKPFVPVRRRGIVTGSVELVGNAIAGTASPLSSLMVNSGHAETLNAGPPANVEYNPVLRNFDSASCYFYHDGEQYRLVGCRSRLTSISMEINNFITAGFELLGQVDGYAETAVPSDDVSAFQDPPALTESSMAVSIGGVDLDGVSLNLDLGVNLALAYSSERVIARQTARAVTGTLRVYRPQIATKDIRAMARDQTKQALAVVLNTGTPWQTTAFTGSSVQFGEPQNVNIDGLKGWDIPVRLLPVSGNDDYLIRFGDNV